jgi:hypothetical protein
MSLSSIESLGSDRNASGSADFDDAVLEIVEVFFA